MSRVTSIHTPSLDVLMRLLQCTNTSWLHLQRYQPSAPGVQTQPQPELSESQQDSAKPHFSIACLSLCCPSLIQWLRPLSICVLSWQIFSHKQVREGICYSLWKSLPSLIPHWTGHCNGVWWEFYQGSCGRISMLESVCSLTHSTQRPQ